MTDTLRTRIAKALQGEADDGFTWEDWLPLADAVIRELGLERQDHYDPYCDHYRYVTDWIAPND